ncbi:glucosamine-6-phosphate deaminase [Flavitalea sp.]|nr:glucosamine-6-phosphate deaminase [Flavitalea sp.]
MMGIHIYGDSKQAGIESGKQGARFIREAITNRGSANIILATGTSQFETLNQLRSENIDWSKVCLFHLDEYIDLPVTHPASFRNYLIARFISKVKDLKAVYLINGEAQPAEECIRLSKLIIEHPIDVAFVGIGENGHLAFNDPPADFDTNEPYIVVELNEACRRQQMGEGWFADLSAVPGKAISMSVKQIMKSTKIICTVPDSRKAEAVKNSLENAVSNLFPATILQEHPDCHYYFDRSSAALLSNQSHQVL